MRSVWVGGAVAFAAFAGFAWLAWQVQSPTGVVAQTDLATAQAMREHARTHPGVLEAARDLTAAGGIPVLTAVAAVGGLLLWLCGRTELAICWLVAAIVGGILDSSLKALIGRPRPDASLRDDAVSERNASFPSGHSMGSMIGYGSLGFVAVSLLRRRAARVVAVLLAAVLILAIGGSRIYLRAHWLSDVAGGFAVGGGWLACCITVFGLRNRAKPQG